ncbi:D-xylose 1-dehydrogenase Gfo6 [Natrialbaceae archaeon A-CW1-1]
MALEDTFDHFTRRDWDRDDVDGTVRLAIVGVGGFARNRAIPGIEAGQYCETTTLVTSSSDRLEDDLVEDVDHCIDYDAYLEGEAADAYDAVYVATPNALHGKYAIPGAERGKHVICEKPLDVSVEAARDIVDACEAAGVTLMTAYRLQVEPTIRRARDLVESGAIGDVVQIHGGFSHPLLEHTGPETWRLDPELSGGGALVDLGIYPLNTIRFVLDCDPVCVYANAQSDGGPFDEVDKHVAFQFVMSTGATASCTASFDAHAASRLQFVGTDGMISVSSPFGGTVPQEMVVESGDLRMEYTGPPVDEVSEEFDYFGCCVLTGTTPEPDGYDALADLRVIEAAYESYESRTEIRFD